MWPISLLSDKQMFALKSFPLGHFARNNKPSLSSQCKKFHFTAQSSSALHYPKLSDKKAFDDSSVSDLHRPGLPVDGQRFIKGNTWLARVLSFFQFKVMQQSFDMR